MTFVCLSIPSWPTAAATSAELARRALRAAPRIRLEPGRGLLWADAAGLDGTAVAAALAALMESSGLGPVRAGIAPVPIAADVAARAGTAPIERIPEGGAREFLAPFDVGVLHPPPPPHLFPLLAAVGVECCRDLAALDPQSVEIRFGAEGVRLWKLARADDPRPIFGSRARELPEAGVDWVDYELADQTQVVFIVNSLLASVTDTLAVRREGAHAMTLGFALADRSQVELPVRCSTATADRKTWLRVIRAVLEPVTLPAPVLGVSLRVDQATPLDDRQGDLFDRGFATARAAETALAHVLDKQSDAVVVPEPTRHPLPERRRRWRPDPTGQLDSSGPGGTGGSPPCSPAAPRLTMQLLPSARPVEVQTIDRRGHRVPARYFDGARSHRLSASLGPDRVSGGFGEAPFERDYFQGVRDDGVMVLLYRDLAVDRWHLAGWWD